VYAVIEDGGRQLRVCEGDVLDVDLRDRPEDAKQLKFEQVLLVSDEGAVKVGTPLVKGAHVEAEVVADEVKGPKLQVHRWRRRKASRTQAGHRQRYLRVRIRKIVT
jgi:large subunit ribosomal protein L21